MAAPEVSGVKNKHLKMGMILDLLMTFPRRGFWPVLGSYHDDSRGAECVGRRSQCRRVMSSVCTCVCTCVRGGVPVCERRTQGCGCGWTGRFSARQQQHNGPASNLRLVWVWLQRANYGSDAFEIGVYINVETKRITLRRRP